MPPILHPPTIYLGGFGGGLMSPSGNMRIRPTARSPPRCRLKPFTASKANKRNMSLQFPLAVALLLIRRIPPFRTTGNGDTTAMTPILRRLTQAPAFVLILGHIPRCALPARSRSSCSRWTRSARWRSSASGTLLGGSSHGRSQPTGGHPGGGIRRSHSGTGGRRWKGDSNIALSSSESTS